MRISIVTPSYNQAAFIERTLASVRAQRGAFELEHVVVDGGSTDGTLALLERHRDHLRLVSEPDRGQSDAINKGFRMATGEVLAWLNSDDTYEPGALDAVARALGPGGARWCFGACRVIDADDREIRRPLARYKAWVGSRYSLRRLIGRNFIPQPATFFRRDLLDEAGPLDERLHYAMDYDLWLRFARLARPAFLPQALASFRWHGASKTGGQYRRAARECLDIARAHARGAAERAAIAEHLAHDLGEVAVYGLLDLLAAVRGGARR